MFLVRFRDAPDAGLREAQLGAVLSPLPLHTDARPEDLVRIARDDDALLVLGLLLGVLVLVMLAHTVATASRRARHNHATLRALGYSRHQSRMTVVWQSLTLGALALAIGLPVGIIAGRWLWAEYARGLGIEADVFLPLLPAVVAIAGTAVIAVIASIPSEWYVTRTDVAATLRTGR
jgi:predicted lysophospholipase L1 biosynthesis ABC-type transport system permease subunit